MSLVSANKGRYKLKQTSVIFYQKFYEYFPTFFIFLHFFDTAEKFLNFNEILVVSDEIFILSRWKAARDFVGFLNLKYFDGFMEFFPSFLLA
jgi:hypothetical protein